MISIQRESKPENNSIFTTPRWPSSRRTTSFSSSSSSSSSSTSYSSSFQPPSPPLSPVTSFRGFEGIPFSWESFPGIPKNQIINKNKSNNSSSKKHSNLVDLPLPPVLSKSIPKNKHFITSPMDPFYAALVECSKEGEDEDDKAIFGNTKKSDNKNGHRRSLSDRFGFVNNMSCKNSCVVAETLVIIPRRQHRIGYDLLKKRSG